MGILNIAESEGASRELTAITRASEWLNSPPLTPEALAGRVVLVQFCTYTCINWLRTLPYIRAWTQRYGPELLVLGVHTPEFAFERDVANVRRSLQQMRLSHPIVIDNEYAVWRAFDNHYWPALYFVDGRGRVRDHHFGEGEYEQSERTIQRLVADLGGSRRPRERDAAPVATNSVEAPADWAHLRSPESYLGYERTESFASPGGIARDRLRVYAAPDRLGLNRWALVGNWTIGKQAVAIGGPNGRLLLRFHARDVHLVMGPPRRSAPIRFRIAIDGRPPGSSRGTDVDEGGLGTAVEQRLYQLVRQPGPIFERLFEIEFLDPGAEVFAFTFG